MSKRGVTLIEILLCCLILSVAVLSLAILFIRGLQLQQKASTLLQASQLSQQLLERIRQLPQPVASTYLFDGRQGTPPSDGFPPAPYPTSRLDARDYTFVVRCRPQADGLRFLTVQVFFDEQQLTFETLVDP